MESGTLDSGYRFWREAEVLALGSVVSNGGTSKSASYPPIGLSVPAQYLISTSLIGLLGERQVAELADRDPLRSRHLLHLEPFERPLPVAGARA